MPQHLRDLPRHLREQTADAIRERERGLAEDAASALSRQRGLDVPGWSELAALLLTLLRQAVEEGELDARTSPIAELEQFSPPLTARDLIHALHRLEGVVLDELALHERLGATSEPWPVVANAVRAGILEIIAGFAERGGNPVELRDELTTLLTRPVFDLALQQEVRRAVRHKHGVSMLLFDVDDLSALNRQHGLRAGDRLLELMGVLSRRFFRTHDWVARHGPDSIAVLLPETPQDQAARLALRFISTIRERLILRDHKTDVTTAVTVSSAAVGTDLVSAELDPATVVVEAEAAVVRAKMNGGNRVERVALLPTSVTIAGAATLLGLTGREVVALMRNGSLRAVRRGRHFHIDRSEIDEYRSRRDRGDRGFHRP